MRSYRKNSDQGFTILELIIVVVIVGLLGAIGIPAVLHQRQEGTKAGLIAELTEASKSIEVNKLLSGTNRYGMLEDDYVQINPDAVILVTLTIDANYYCLETSEGEFVFSRSSDDAAPQERACPFVETEYVRQPAVKPIATAENPFPVS